MIAYKKPDEALMKEVLDDRERLKKEAEDAFKANKKNADEIAKYHGEDTKNWKKEGGAVIKLSESLFEELDPDEYINFDDEMYETLTHVCNHYISLGLTKAEVEKVIDRFISEYDDEAELDEDDFEEIPGFEGTSSALDKIKIFGESRKAGKRKNIKESWSVYYIGDDPEDGTLFDDEDSANKFRDEMGDDWEVIQLNESKEDNIEKFYVAAYFDENMRGLEDNLMTDNFDEAIDFIHHYANNGNTVEIKNQITGERQVYSPDEWMEEIEYGDIPQQVKKLNESSEIKRYSDVIPKEQRKFWYFTTHGVMPGSIPKGVNVLETREGKNDKGTNGTFVCLDAILNTSELKEYDLKEMVPQDLRESVDTKFLIDREKEILNILKDIWVEDINVDRGFDGKVVHVYVKGDWKHDHLRCNYLMKEQGYTLIGENVYEEDGSDSYASEHIFYKG